MKDISQLNEIFDLPPLQEAKDFPIASVTEQKNLEIEDDYNLARKTMRSILIKGEGTFDEIVNLARNSEHPRSYEVAGQLMKTISDVAKDLLHLQKQVKEIQKDSSEINNNASIGTQNNIVFAGTTTELLKMLKNEKPIDG
ncbi:MAG: hypothetical protein EBU90_07640 [Proteobacteria bacterium]|nr:hypothetical protein [Pseudomonadota bacterium]NBP13426.1 hypothetical protein [bacterium]